MCDEVAGEVLGGGEERRARGARYLRIVLSVAIDHGEAVQPPGLTTGPCRTVRETLRSELADHGASGGIVVDHVEGAAVRADVILHSFQGVANGVIAQGGTAAILSSKQQQLQVHHVVDDDGDVAVVGGPRLDYAN